jgi:hypothetical protein
LVRQEKGIVMTRLERPALIVVAGWSLVVVFGVLVWLGAGELGSGALFAGVGLAMGIWVTLRPGVSAMVVSLVLGLLHTAEQIAYLAFDISESDMSVGRVLGDAEGLLGGLLIVGGAVAALLQRRRTHAVVEPVG